MNDVSLSRQIAPWLPRLRHYAHALTGSSRRGDNRVRILLELLLADPGQVRRDQPVHIELFRLFHAVVQTLKSAADLPAEPDVDAQVRRAVADLSPRSRQILLLSALVQLPDQDIASILGIDAQMVSRRLQYARERLQRRLSARVLIVEDERAIASEIERAVEGLGHQVVGIANNERNAVELARQSSPELVVVDAKLHDDRTAQNIRTSTHVPVIVVEPQRRRGGARRRSQNHVDSRALQKTIMRALPLKAALRESLSETLRAH